MFTDSKCFAAGTGKEYHVSSGETDPQTIHHHRDDGITGIPRHQLNEIQAHAPSPAGGLIPPGEPIHADRSTHPPGDYSGM